MTGLKTYDIFFHDLTWDCRVQINFDHPGIQETIKQLVEFWYDWEKNLRDNEGDYVLTFLKQLGRDILIIECGESLSSFGMKSAFEDREGWCKMDGSQGILIMRHDTIEFDQEQMEVKEVIV